MITPLNANSLIRPGRQLLLQQFIQLNNIDILLVQETGFAPGHKFAMPGFNIIRNDVRRGWVGTALLVRSNVPVRNQRRGSDTIHAVTPDRMQKQQRLDRHNIHIFYSQYRGSGY